MDDQWERVCVLIRDLARLYGCDRCHSVACECYRQAVFELPGSPATGTGNGAGFYGVPFDDD